MSFEDKHVSQQQEFESGISYHSSMQGPYSWGCRRPTSRQGVTRTTLPQPYRPPGRSSLPIETRTRSGSTSTAPLFTTPTACLHYSPRISPCTIYGCGEEN